MQDFGGEFFSQKQDAYGSKPSNLRLETDPVYETVEWPSWCQRGEFSGPVWPIHPGLLSFPPAMNSSDLQLMQLGATAVARAKPTNTIENLGASLGEIAREGISSFSAHWKDVVDAARKGSGDYLNIEFGLRPIISELYEFADRVSRADDILRQYERDAGKVVRRRWDFPPKLTTTADIPFTGRDVYYDPFNTRHGGNVNRSVARVRVFEQRQWFSGAFTYHLPTDYDSRRELDSLASKVARLYDLSLTPEVIWELAPWSWAVDWFSNVGDVVSNVTDWANDGLVMRYGYLMEHTIVTDTYTRVDPRAFASNSKNASQLVTSAIVLKTETKIRKRANPFGFGVSWSGLSPRQLSIAAALGISRS